MVPRVVEALAMFCRPVQALAVAVLRESDVMPPREMEPPPERPEPAETVSEEFWSWLFPIVLSRRIACRCMLGVVRW